MIKTPVTYIVLYGFKFGTRTFLRGEVLKESDVWNIPENYRKEFLYTRDFNKIELALNFGNIFLSKEYPFPEYHEAETREQVIKRLECEMKKCCDNTNKPFINEENYGKTD